MLPLESQPIKTLSSTTLLPSTSLSSSSSIDVSDLASVLIQCFVLILAGYLSGKFGLISEEESNGISIFVGDFSLPALIFQSLAISDLSTINWGFVASIFVSKIFLFVLVALITIIITKPPNYGLAGLYGIFCTKSNDFAVGYPLLISLYRDKHPDYADYMYVLGSIQLGIVNPIGLIMMEIQQQIRNKTDGKNGLKIFIKIIKQICKSPTLIMTFAGITSNLIFGPILPHILKPFINCLSEAFSAAGLFLLGLNIVGKFTMFQSKDNSSANILLPLILVMGKNLLLPLINKFVIQYLVFDNSGEEAVEWANFGFLFGTFPTAPTVFIFALQYNLTTAIISTAMILSTIFSAPLMFISAYMISQMDHNSIDYQNDFKYTMCYSGLISVVCILWVLIVFIFNRKWNSLTHRCTLALVISQLFVGFGGFLWNYMDYELISNLQYIFSLFGTISLQIWTCILAITMALLHSRKSLCYIIKFHNILVFSAAFSTFILIFYIIFDNFYQLDDHNGTFKYISIYILELSIIMTMFAILAQQYLYGKSNYYQTFRTNNSCSVTPTSSSECALNHGYFNEEKQLSADETSCKRRNSNKNLENVNESEDVSYDISLCNQNICYYKENEKSIESLYKNNFSHINESHQMLQHLLLLLILLFSMIIKLTVLIGKIIFEQPSGVFVELQFLDILLNYGQGVMTFLIFGLDANFKNNKKSSN